MEIIDNKLKCKLFIVQSELCGEPYYSVFDFDPTNRAGSDRVLIGSTDFEYEIPADFNPVAAQVQSLHKQLDTLADEYHGKVAHIKGRINDLLCLEAPDHTTAPDDRPLPTSVGLHQ